MKDTLLCFIQRDTQKVTELSFLACLESTRDHQKDFEHSRSRAALRLIYAASEGRFGIVAAAVKVSSEGQWKAEAAHVQKWALIYSRARMRRRRQLQESSSTKKHTAATAFAGAYASSSYFGCQVQWALLFPPTNFTYNRELQYTQGQFDFKLD